MEISYQEMRGNRVMRRGTAASISELVCSSWLMADALGKWFDYIEIYKDGVFKRKISRGAIESANCPIGDSDIYWINNIQTA